MSDEDCNPCMYYTAAKTKQKGLSRSGNAKATVSNRRVGIGISTVKPRRKSEIIVSKPNWLTVIDERCWTKLFHKQKDDIVGYLADNFQKYRNMGIPVLRVRCDNTGENRSVEKEINGHKWRLDVKFQYTTRHNT